MAPATLRDEAVGLLQELLRLDTVNPPGNETRAAELLRAYLEGSGVACELYAREPERANLVARIPGRGEGPSLLLLSHTDTVVADPAEWSVDPWSGELKDGCVWGRGALDMKGHVAAAATAIATLAREGFEPAGDLVFAATADEEVGVDVGLSWLCRAHPDAVRTDYCVNEGGGERVGLGGRTVYLCTTAEKMSAPFRLKVHGRSGHASMPGIADNALVRAARLIERVAALRQAPRLIPETEALFAGLGEVPEPAELDRAVAGLPPEVRQMVEPMLGLALSPTIISASRAHERHPGPLRGRLRLPPAAGGHARGRRAGDPRGARGGLLRPGVGRGRRRHALAARDAALGRDRVVRRRGRSRAPASFPSSRRASRTATSCARRSARSPTASSRCARWIRSWPRG